MVAAVYLIGTLERKMKQLQKVERKVQFTRTTTRQKFFIPAGIFTHYPVLGMCLQWIPIQTPKETQITTNVTVVVTNIDIEA